MKGCCYDRNAGFSDGFRIAWAIFSGAIHCWLPYPVVFKAINSELCDSECPCLRSVFISKLCSPYLGDSGAEVERCYKSAPFLIALSYPVNPDKLIIIQRFLSLPAVSHQLAIFAFAAVVHTGNGRTLCFRRSLHPVMPEE